MLFQRVWRSRSAASVNAASPIVAGDRIFISASYETGAALMRVQGNALAEIWSSDEAMSNHYATSVVHNGVLYGFHGRQEFNPSFRAVDLDSGKVRWSVDRFHAGTVTLAGDSLLILKETGELLLARGVARSVPAGRAGADPAADGARASRDRRRLPLRAQQRHAEQRARLHRPAALSEEPVGLGTGD